MPFFHFVAAILGLTFFTLLFDFWRLISTWPWSKPGEGILICTLTGFLALAFFHFVQPSGRRRLLVTFMSLLPLLLSTQLAALGVLPWKTIERLVEILFSPVLMLSVLVGGTVLAAIWMRLMPPAKPPAT